MNELEQYLAWVTTRLEDGGVVEEPDLEIKSDYKPTLTENEALWELADLVSALANDTRIDGFRALIYGPRSKLNRPAWLPDESRLRDKLLRYFEGGVVPAVELLRRQTGSGLDFDAFVVVARDETPYVSRVREGGVWVVRVRTNTARRTATRAELIALSGGRKKRSGSVRRLEARLAPLGKGTRRVVVTNVGTITVRDVLIEVPEDSGVSLFGTGDTSAGELNPGESHTFPVSLHSRGFDPPSESVRLVVSATAEDAEPVSTTIRVSKFD